MGESEESATSDEKFTDTVNRLNQLAYINELHRAPIRTYINAILNAAIWRDGIRGVSAWDDSDWDEVQMLVERALQLELDLAREHEYQMVLTVKEQKSGT